MDKHKTQKIHQKLYTLTISIFFTTILYLEYIFDSRYKDLLRYHLNSTSIPLSLFIQIQIDISCIQYIYKNIYLKCDTSLLLTVLEELIRALPLGQATFSEARDDDRVEGLLSARDSDAQRPAEAFQLHSINDGARALLLVCNTGQQHTGVPINTAITQDTSQRGREQSEDTPHNTGQREEVRRGGRVGGWRRIDHKIRDMRRENMKEKEPKGKQIVMG